MRKESEQESLLGPSNRPGREPKKFTMPLPPDAVEVNADTGRVVEGQILTGSPPENPEMLTESMTLQRDVAELRAALERQREEFDQRARQWELERELQAGSRQSPHVDFRIPDGVNPRQSITVEDFYRVMSEVVPAIQSSAEARAIRTVWSVTPDQEQAILQQYPQVAEYPEPQRTRFVQKAAEKLFGQGKPSVSAARQQQSQPQASSQGQPLDQRVVPLGPSPGTPQGIGEPQKSDLVLKLRQEYEAAKKIKNPQQQKIAMREAMDKLARASGYQDRGGLFQGSWKSSG